MFVNWLPSTAGSFAVPSNCTTLFAEVPTFWVEAVPNPEIFVFAIVATAKLIVPEDVIGEPVTVNSEAPESATATWVTVPPDDGNTCVKVISETPNVAEVSVVQRNKSSAWVEPSWTTTICPASSAIES